jgi:hypothetical protein
VLVKSYVGMVTLVGGAALVLAALIMRVTTPLVIGPLGVTAWFLLVLIGLSCVCTAIAYIVASLVPHSSGRAAVTVRRRVMDSSRRGLLLGSYIAILLALSSLQQLNLRDAALLILLFGLVEFYTVARRER